MALKSTFGGSTKLLMTVVSPSMETSPALLSELSKELRDLWPLVPPL
jgi:hypothetical protein